MFVSRFLYSFLCFVSFSIYVSLSLCLYPDSYILFYVLCLFLCMPLSLSLSMFVILHLSLSTYRRSFIRVSMSLHVPFYPFNTPLIC